MRFAGRCAVIVLSGMLCVSASAKPHRKAHPVKPLKLQVARLLADPAVSRSHWGIAVTKMDGKPIYALNAEQFFHPASNAKLFTTAAAMALLGPEATVKTTARIDGLFNGKEHIKGDVYLYGEGDANLSGRTIPYAPDTSEASPPLRDLDDMAARIASTGVKTVDGDVIGIGDHFGNEPYPQGWSVDDLPWGYGAPVSALSVNDNQLKVTITPATELSSRASIEIIPAVPYYTVVNDVMTVSAGEPTSIAIDRMPGSKTLRVYGRMAMDATPETDHISIDDPAEFAAVAFKQLLEQHGITISGRARAEHVVSQDTRSFNEILHEPMDLAQLKTMGKGEPDAADAVCSGSCDPAKIPHSLVVVGHISPTLLEDIVLTNKSSLNLHAELILRRLGDRFAFDPSSGSFAQGARVVRQFLIDAGISGDDFYFYDGSGLSSYDLVTPQATSKLLQYAATQPWFADWKSSLPVGGVDGTLVGRFTQAPLKGHVFAKTGTLGEARALSGYLDCASGRTVIFSIMVDNHAPHSHADEATMDKIVAAIAETN